MLFLSLGFVMFCCDCSVVLPVFGCAGCTCCFLPFSRMPREYNEDEDPAARRRKKKR